MTTIVDRGATAFATGACLAGVCLCWSLTAGVAQAQTRTRALAPETYVSATVDANGDMAITRADGHVIVVPKDGEQRAFSTPKVSGTGRAVGAQAMFGNCCTSYDIPLQVVVLLEGKVHRFTGIGLPMFQWGFADNGARIAYGQETVHFSCATHYELRDIRTERLIESIDVPRPCGQNPSPRPVKVPRWVGVLQGEQ
jgi:hypothetical protein